MTFQNFFYTLAPLRVANLSSGSQGHPTSLGDFRNFVRQYARQFGDPALGEAASEVLLDAIVLLHERGCLELKKFTPPNLWWDISEIRDIWKFVNGGFTMKLTPKGRELLSEMEAQLIPPLPGRNPIGFHAGR
jgi:hypothetical protein